MVVVVEAPVELLLGIEGLPAVEARVRVQRRAGMESAGVHLERVKTLPRGKVV